MRGVLPAIVTPLTEDEQFVPASFEKLCERLYEAGAHGLYVCGQTGEGPLLPVAVRKQVAECAMRCSPKGKTVVIHIGASRTSDAVDLARHASRIGAHAISSLPPESRYSFVEVRRYYEAIAAASDVPVLVYYFPEVSAAVSTLDQIFELCSIPNVIGLKFTDFDLYRMSLIQRAGHVIFNGRDEVFAAGMLMGACGGIGSFYNLVPELFVSIYNLSQAGNHTEARQVQDKVNDLIRFTVRFPMLPAIKQMLTASGIPCGPCVSPRRRLTPTELEALKTGDSPRVS